MGHYDNAYEYDRKHPREEVKKEVKKPDIYAHFPPFGNGGQVTEKGKPVAGSFEDKEVTVKVKQVYLEGWYSLNDLARIYARFSEGKYD